MIRANISRQTINHRCALSIRVITLALMVGVTSVSTYASPENTAQIAPPVAHAQSTPNNQALPNESADISERFAFSNEIHFTQGGGHRACAVLGNACIDRVGDAYLFDLAIPAEGLSCPAQPIRFNPPAAADGKRTMDAVNPDSLWRQ